jgi:hypothetical protein
VRDRRQRPQPGERLGPGAQRGVGDGDLRAAVEPAAVLLGIGDVRPRHEVDRDRADELDQHRGDRRSARRPHEQRDQDRDDGDGDGSGPVRPARGGHHRVGGVFGRQADSELHRLRRQQWGEQGEKPDQHDREERWECVGVHRSLPPSS